MANTGIQHQLRRGTNAQMNTFVGAQGEPTFDTTFNRLVLHDGVTAGGYAHALATTQTSTASTSINTTTSLFLCNSTAAAQTLILPTAASYAPGQVLTVWDAYGISTSFNITVVTAAVTDFVYTSTGGASTTAMIINTAGAQCQLISNSSVHWMLMSTT
jgi:hypothetical protein